MDMKRKMRILFGLLLFFGGSFCFLYPDFRERKIQRNVEQIIEDFRDAHAADRGEEKGSGLPAAQEDEVEDMVETNGLSELYTEMQAYNERLRMEGQHIVDAWSYERSAVDLSLLADGDCTLGYIEIPDMETRLPLLLGASKENLANGAVVLSGTSMPIGGEDTNCVIAAHRGWRGSAYFQYIENMRKGSYVYITNQWETLVYRAEAVKIIKPDDVDSILIQEGKDMITLLSCHPYMSGGKYRYLVYCERDRTSAVQEESDFQKAKETDGEEVHRNEKSGPADGKDKEAFSADLIVWEGYLRTGLPLLTFLAAFFIVFFRHFRQK